ncbi:MAG: DUF1512 domain-containing protein [Candidatus Aenigmarchaeota archaeon CG_4_10_14_0_8_um_filter_37_24]|nr:MAG: DUF1512 domain-containing protein [Candidatus Aenigmarchaeota archaeon CG_4_10_14_3_um_filter_37_21]PIZ35634.1 MAG: DUF1512 domain-containing protein [Candidatus Aenigmarchaeota archaeon CG_4_10_14_0_8_um_filter_37_24]
MLNLALFPTDSLSQVVNILFWIVLLVFYPKIMVAQVMFQLENSVIQMEQMSEKAKDIVLKKISKKPDKKTKEQVKNFMEFFVIPPVDMDPYGIVKKFEHIIELEKGRFNYFVSQVAPALDSENKANIVMGLSASMSLYQITKVMRHFVELIKKTKSYNLALIIQMQLPLIKSIAKSLYSGTEALSNGLVIGDGIGPYVAANYVEDGKVEEVDDETVMSRKKVNGRDVIVLKAKGPGGRTGNQGKVLEKIFKKEKIAKIITVDAAAKLEGEKTGSIAEGIGVAMGGIGVERSYIEDVAVKNKIPVDSVIVKMSQEEAIMAMTKPVLEATPKVLKILEETIARTKEKGSIVLIGVGNTSGVGNNKKDAAKAEGDIRREIAKMEKEKKEKKRRFRLPF